MDALQGPALAEALARLVGVPVERVTLRSVPLPGGDDCAARCVLRSVAVELCRGIDSFAFLVFEPLTHGKMLAEGRGPTPEAARDDAISRLRAGYDAVRDVLDPWREGPPDTDGWYEVECEYRVDEAPTEPGVWTDGMWLLPGDASGWPTVSGRPARYRALHLSAPPERGTDA
jgi:hypothetical protein